MAYVYSHHKASTGEIFYIGISKASDGMFVRALDTNKRSRIWKSIVKKHGFTMEIVRDGITWEEAIELEIALIAKYGRIHNKTGTLCNLTIGGEGCQGFPITDEYRRKCSEAQKGRPGKFGEENPFFGRKHSAESMLKKSETTKKNGKLKGENNPNFGKPLSPERREYQRQFRLGQKHPEETKAKIRAWGKGKPKSEEWKDKMRGTNNPWYGKKISEMFGGKMVKNERRCVCIETGEEFESLKEACEIKAISYHTQVVYIQPNHIRHKNRKFNYL